MLNLSPQLVAISTIILLFTVTLSRVHALRVNSNLRHKLPPGPRGLPLIGNLLQVPGKHLATYFRNLLEQYGGIVSLKVATFNIILIGDMKLAKELLEKRSTKYSSRPVVPYINYHVDPTKDYWSMFEEGENHSIARKLTAGIMSTVRTGKTEPLQEFEAVVNIQSLLDDGGRDWFHHLRRTVSSSVMAAEFGIHCPTGNESDLNAILRSIADLGLLATPSASITNAFPILDYIPGPMPWRARARAFREQDNALYKKLVDEAVIGKTSGMNTWAAAFARKDKPEGDQRRLLKQVAAAAIETSAISLQTFVLACIRYPSWIGIAQKEIDAVVGRDRLPSFKDRPLLPYVEAVVRETLRWRPAVRFGVPHKSTVDDVVEYHGQQFFIPKDSIIFAVTWAIEHDRSRFEDHDVFKPERFLDAEGNLKQEYVTSAFGFGRRICPGIPFAERSLWINIAKMLWTFNIRGSDIPEHSTGLPFCYDDSDAAFTGDVTNTPFEFPAIFEPRSAQRVEVARREWEECEKDLNILLPALKEPL